ncbi:hypothetical protein [Paraburkholderia phenoliruptrix]|uniref:hypothetical protein n=1 Tax=Paraburkholderia phenoliruptrix TaxID=252970 RepID=UPI0015840D73|nr:hypothetical protein [Paraburkholderia phenoliruptrix]
MTNSDFDSATSSLASLLRQRNHNKRAVSAMLSCVSVLRRQHFPMRVGSTRLSEVDLKFRKRDWLVEATQWFSPGDHAAVEQRNGAWSIATAEGWSDVHPGDWVITSSDGSVHRISNQLFYDLYEPLA